MDKDKRGEKYATTKEKGSIFFRKNSNDVHLQNSEENGSSGKLSGVTSIVINTILFRPEQPKFFVPVCKPVPETPPFHLGSNFGQFRSILVVPVNFGRYANFGRNRMWPIIKKKKTVKVQTTPLDFTKRPNLRPFFFHSFTFTFTLKSLTHCRRARAHCRCSMCSLLVLILHRCALSISRLSHTHLSLTLSQSHSLGLNSQIKYSFSTLTLSDSSFSQIIIIFFLMIFFVVKI